MAINFPNGFNVTGKEAIDSRIVLTKEQMLNTKKASMPDVYLAVCKDDGKLYIYNAINAVDEETGRFRVIEGGGIGEITPEMITNIVSQENGNRITINEDGLFVEDCDCSPISTDVIKNLFSTNEEDGGEING